MKQVNAAQLNPSIVVSWGVKSLSTDHTRVVGLVNVNVNVNVQHQKGDRPPTGALPMGEFLRPTSLHTRKGGRGETVHSGTAGDRDVRGTEARKKVRRPRKGPEHGAWGGGGGLLM